MSAVGLAKEEALAKEGSIMSWSELSLAENTAPWFVGLIAPN